MHAAALASIDESRSQGRRREAVEGVAPTLGFGQTSPEPVSFGDRL